MHSRKAYPSSIDYDHGVCNECGHEHTIAKKQPSFIHLRSTGLGGGF